MSAPRKPEGDDCEKVDDASEAQQQDGGRDSSIRAVEITDAPDTETAGRGSNIEETKQRRSRASIQVVADVTKKATAFTKEVVSRLMAIVIILFILGFLTGGLMNWGAWHLLDKADASDWEQPWGMHRKRDLKPEWNNLTYVKIYSEIHRYRNVELEAPKFSDIWVYVYYLRGTVAMMVGYGSPFFIMMSMHGVHKMWKCTAICYTPFVLISLIFALANSMSVCTSGGPFVSGMFEIASIGVLSIIEAAVVLPLLGKYLDLQHMGKVVIFPFVLMNIGLFILKFGMPMITVHLSDYGKVFFRLFIYSGLTELFVGKARMACRLVPLIDEDVYRPEDKVFAVLGLDCLFGYWGRIILMDLQDPGAVLVANFGNMFLEFLARVTVVQRDKFYLALTYCSFEKRSSYWSTNARGMMRFRCSMIISHLFSEYLMIAAACSFFWFSGLAPSLSGLIYNTSVQVITELMVDVVTLYWEIVKHKLPVIPAWFDRQKHWGPIFGLFVVGFNLFAISQAGEYYCAMRKPDNPDFIMLHYCGAAK